ncbi:hypothetical protein TSAR_002022 [Trichomalopsis sarcophagae]|uniref:Integrase catalytic domain-containing protein n=1 Tax=Trichomalopsis sarcophagae TaxID=543379 RepID=A0A232EDX1_9HYME|nr:hypothetical protein TSAR_002022 [Trichomalopsis sarcophagae]
MAYQLRQHTLLETGSNEWFDPLRDKTAKSVASGLEQILQRNDSRQPIYFQTDKSKEFIGREVQN